jgi:hypothetical protein
VGINKLLDSIKEKKKFEKVENPDEKLLIQTYITDVHVPKKDKKKNVIIRSKKLKKSSSESGTIF